MQILRTIVAFVTPSIVLVLILPVIAGIVVLLAVSWGTRLIGRVLEPRFMTWQELIEFDPIAGWKTKSNLDTCALVDDLFHFTTDTDGWRGRRTSLKDSD